MGNPLLLNLVINWLIQTTAAHPGLAEGQAPPGMLSAEEAAIFERFKFLKRRQDWLLGRWTAKHLLQELIYQYRGQRIALDSITILPGADGAPLVKLEAAIAAQNPPFTISISHSHGSSLCAAVAQSERPLGADIERIESRAKNFAAEFFSEEEQEQVKRTVPDLQDALITAIWSAKEAALKATHEGLRVDTRSVTCQIDAPAELPKKWEPFPIQRQQISSPRSYLGLQGWWMINKQYVLTLVIGENQGSQLIEKASYAESGREEQD